MVGQVDREYTLTRPNKAVTRLMSHFLFQGRPLTTGMRWINPLLFAQFSVIKQLPQMKKVEKPIFVLGTGRSGTTILGKVLSMHPYVLFLNEPKALWHVIYPHEDVIGSYSREFAQYRLDEKDVTPAVMQTAHRLYGYCLALTGSQRILDKYPEMIFRVPFIQSIFPDAKFIFLVRNGWDTIHSISNWSQHEGEQARVESHDWWGVDRRKWNILVRDIVAEDDKLSEKKNEIIHFKNQQDMAAVEWMVTLREGQKLLDSSSYQVHQTKYENLVNDPEKILKNLLMFCELPEDDKFIAYAKRTLLPVPRRSTVDLHSAIKDPFTELVNDFEEINRC
jgi:hypothetical protein